MRTTAALLKFYASNPSFVVRHAGKATKIVSSGGIKQFFRLVRTRMRATDDDINRRDAQRKRYRRLSLVAQNRKKNISALLESLVPYADDLTVLDVVHGEEDRLRLIHCHILKKYKLLDEEFYTRTYLHDVQTIRPADHYAQYGLASGLKPNAFFDPLEYLDENPDVADLGMDPIIHYALFGWREKRSAGSLFDGNYYLEANPDVAAVGISPLIHFLDHGRYEHRTPRPAGLGEGGFVGMGRTSGTIVLVSHDAQLGGAQQLIRVLGKWLLSSTRYDLKFVIMGGGPFFESFAEIAPSFDVSAHPESEVEVRLKAFAGADVKAVFINSVASGGFFKIWHDPTPAIAFIHELPMLLKLYGENLDLIRDRTEKIIGGSEAVRLALKDEFGIESAKLETVYGFIEAPDPETLVDKDGKQAAKKALGLDPNTFVVTGCGVLHWRKSPDKFIEVAEKVVAAGVDAQFIWIGGGPDQKECEQMVVDKGLERQVQITGYEPDIMRYLNASDLFLLPSEEDPFPLVCLYAAMALNPVICFQKAGGMPEFVAQGCGVAVPFGNVDAMAEQVLLFAKDTEHCTAVGRAARDLVQARYTVTSTGPQLLHHIREAAGLKPHASVVVPNYNYERFLPERLRSIRDQSFQDFEVILLDDRSTDGSVSLMKQWAGTRPGTRLVVNEENSGSPFAQWLRGMRMANSELIWIAEADDACSPDFLATLLPYFEDRNVFLGYTKSVPVDENGERAGDYEAMYLNRIADGRWSRPYVVTDHEEANEALGVANCIPNASSVIFRRFDPELDFETSVTKMRMCGDWLFYLRAMRGGLVAYSNEALNFHRRHTGTVTHGMEGSPRYFDEFATVRSYVSRNYRLNDAAIARVEEFTRGDLDRFGLSDANERNRILSMAGAKEKGEALPSILFVASDLSPGGGQIFVIRLANAWVRRGGRAVLLNARHFPDHAQVVAKIDPRVALFHARDPGASLLELIERFDLDLVHSALWWADRHVHDDIGKTPGLPWISTMHGCYETILNHPAIDLSFEGRIGNMLARVDRYVHTADKNMRVFEVYGEPKGSVRIVNGVEVEPGHAKSRDELGLRNDAVVLCLASRAIAEKGWFEAVELTDALNAAGCKVDLMLIGEGPAADTVRKQAPRNVHLYGQVSNLQDYIAAADIGLLPSTFIGESMPLVLLEMMAVGKPVIATDVGEIGAIVGGGAQAGGIVVPLRYGKVDVAGFAAAIRSLLDKKRRARMGARARKRFEAQFTTDQMVQNYENLYRTVIAERAIRSEFAVVGAAQ